MIGLPKVFIHIPKNGGMTLRRNTALRGKIITAGPDVHKSREYTQNVKEVMDKHRDHHGFEHARWRDCNRSLLEAHGSFCIIRNPWDRVVSRYMFIKKIIEVEKKEPGSYADVSSFEAFLEERHKWGDVKFMWHRATRGWYPALDHVTDLKGNIMPDVLSFEHYNEDIPKYLGLAEVPRARNVTGLLEGVYTDVYTPETRNIVGDWYKADVDAFGYDFGSGPTKNIWRLK